MPEERHLLGGTIEQETGGMKIVGNAALALDDDPRPKDRAMWNRLKLVVEAELCDRAWGCKLYQMHREGLIDNAEREAGDKYQIICRDFERWQDTDPDTLIAEAQEFALKKIQVVKRRFNDCIEILGLRRKVVDSVVLHEEWPAYETHKKEVKRGLGDLANFFAKGTKGQQRKIKSVV